MVQEFIRKNGVSKCPGFGTPEFRELNIAREKARFEGHSKAMQRWRKTKATRLQKALRS